MKRRAAVAALALLVPLGAGASVAVAQERPAARVVHAASRAITLNGAGANSINPFFQAVFYNYHQKYPNVTINYSPAGSSVGISDIQQNTVAFGDTEVPMASKDLALAKGTVLQIPVDLGGVAISYNVPGAPKGLRLDGSALAGIFEGIITNWDSPALASVTGDSNLPNLPIVPVHRADSWPRLGPGRLPDPELVQLGVQNRFIGPVQDLAASQGGRGSSAEQRRGHVYRAKGRGQSGSLSTATPFRLVSPTQR